MRIPELALGAVVAWSAIGLAGTALSWRRGDRPKARRGLLTIAAVCLAYFAILLTVSHRQPQRRLAVGQDECFGTVCYAAVGAEEIAGFSGGDAAGALGRERLIRVSLRVTNRAPAGLAARPRIHPYLIDASHRIMHPVPGLSGNNLDRPMLANQPVISRPVFRVPDDATGLSLVLTEGPWQPGFLEIGGTDSWMHRPTLLPVNTAPVSPMPSVRRPSLPPQGTAPVAPPSGNAPHAPGE